jgi:hypothetical protein
MALPHRATVLLASWLLLAPTALAQEKDKLYGVRDEAGLFNKEAVKKADEDLVKIHEQYKKDVFVETLKEGPKENFLDWARARAQKRRFSGVYVIITLEPHKLEVLIDKQTREKGFFTQANVEELAKLMLNLLREGKKDDALTTGTKYTLDAFRKNSPNNGDGECGAARQKCGAAYNE